MSEALPPDRDVVSWDHLDRLVAELADRLVGERFDVMLAITLGSAGYRRLRRTRDPSGTWRT